MEELIIRAFEQSADVKLSFVKKNLKTIISVVELIVEAFHEGNKVMLFGNGGSAADAQHIAAEFVNRFMIERPPLPAMALTTDTSVITSIGNDYNYDQVFLKQIKALGKEGDIAWGISTSGNSPNVLKALKEAKKMGLKTIGMTGKDGGKMAKMVDYLLNVESDVTARIQETHITLSHVICELVDIKLFNPST
ncbi:MAG: D-sedoheptulose 7-phosphate isomerase [Deltaproteobacteria bacterium]|nr:D-sedoheptulose 7-phosphate isomerase [Deltaproteobacteria bacterium]